MRKLVVSGMGIGWLLSGAATLSGAFPLPVFLGLGIGIALLVKWAGLKF